MDKITCKKVQESNQSGINAASFISSERKNTLSGIFFENFVADEFNSLEKFANHNKFEYAIKVSRNNYVYDEERKLLTVPFYFFPFVAKELADGRMEV